MAAPRHALTRVGPVVAQRGYERGRGSGTRKGGTATRKAEAHTHTLALAHTQRGGDGVRGDGTGATVPNCTPRLPSAVSSAVAGLAHIEKEGHSSLGALITGGWVTGIDSYISMATYWICIWGTGLRVPNSGLRAGFGVLKPNLRPCGESGITDRDAVCGARGGASREGEGRSR